jgi:hypothetical protein
VVRFGGRKFGEVVCLVTLVIAERLDHNQERRYKTI